MKHKLLKQGLIFTLLSPSFFRQPFLRLRLTAKKAGTGKVDITEGCITDNATLEMDVSDADVVADGKIDDNDLAEITTHSGQQQLYPEQLPITDKKSAVHRIHLRWAAFFACPSDASCPQTQDY